ncbi:hypothetical protein [Jannaschia pohangensis]|uniref:Nucleotidyltransferase domain-containing protein n=1 Tax=Jannaschia pohangensis TaxID=390807 RepID=A0A1I3IH38_9RHOB|nr:hypothetical protein [Jannaschia pohangensis]SFI47308.1 hypothetical protein SAMN04488095_0969 [Jannaschia pohangensis]
MTEFGAVPDARLIAPLERLIETPGLTALFLAGSHGRGAADAFSDIDLLAVAEADALADVGSAWQAALGAALPIVHWDRRDWGGTLVNAITEDWLRVDLFVVPGLDRRARDLLVPLHDPADLWSAMPASLPAAEPDPARVARLSREIIRIIGLLPLGAGRKEVVTLLWGLNLLRDAATQLMQEECPLADRGGVLHLSRLIRPDRMAVLLALPQPPARLPEVTEAYMAYAAILLPLAREMSERLALDWPEAFEAATRAHLRKAMDLDLPSSTPAGQ